MAATDGPLLNNYLSVNVSFMLMYQFSCILNNYLSVSVSLLRAKFRALSESVDFFT